MPDKIEEAVQEIIQNEGVTHSEALFILLCQVGKKYVDEIQGMNDREETIESAVEALEENLHNVVPK
jgi:hypothetical protein